MFNLRKILNLLVLLFLFSENISLGCVLYDIVNGKPDVSGRKPAIIYESDNFVFIVDLGSIVEGYMLLVSKRHINSMGELNKNEHSDFINIKSKIIFDLEKVYDKKCICFEYGSGLKNHENAESSVKHAHFHIVAMGCLSNDLNNEVIKDMKLIENENLDILKKYSDTPYLYYISGEGKIYISNKKKIESQYMRKFISKQFGTEYDWKNITSRQIFEKNMINTEKKLIKYLKSKM